MTKILDFIKQSKFVIGAAVLSVFIVLAISGCAPSEYNADLKTPVLKKPDIIQNGVLKVGIDYGNLPLAGEGSKPSGIDVDVASAIAEELGLVCEFVDVGSGVDVALSTKKVDIVMGVPSNSNYEKIWKSNEYIKTACAIYSKNANDPMPTAEGTSKLSSQMGSPSALAAQSQFGSGNVALENNVEKCFEKLDSGEVKYVAADALVGTYKAKSKDISASMIALMTNPSGYCIGVDSENKTLSEKIKNALETITKGGIISVIEKKWLGKALELDKVKLTPGASSQTDVMSGEAGVYAQSSNKTTEDQTVTN